MKKAMMLIMVVVSVSVALAGGFQDVEWGMSQQLVKEKIPNKKWKGPALCKNKCIYCEDKVMKLKIWVWFYFDNDKLYKVSLVPEPTTFSVISEGGTFDIYGRKILAVYRALKQPMVEKYGNPKSSDCVNNSHIPNIDSAIISGQAECFDVWETEDTTIKLQIKRKTSAGTGTSLWEPIVVYESRTIKPTPER